MLAVKAASQDSPIWYYLDYLDPRHLNEIVRIVIDKLWRGPPRQVDIPLDEVDEFGQFHRGEEPFPLPLNKPTGFDPVRYSVKLPPNLLDSLEDEMLRRVLGASSRSSMTASNLRSLCVKNSEFLSAGIYAAQKKCSPLYELFHETYLKDYREEPESIQYEPEKIEVVEIGGNMWMNCFYKGKIKRQDGKSIPIEANCNYNLLNPAISSRAIFIDPRREAM
jgi:hypothetical protein